MTLMSTEICFKKIENVFLSHKSDKKHTLKKLMVSDGHKTDKHERSFTKQLCPAFILMITLKYDLSFFRAFFQVSL